VRVCVCVCVCVCLCERESVCESICVCVQRLSYVLLVAAGLSVLHSRGDHHQCAVEKTLTRCWSSHTLSSSLQSPFSH